MLANDDQDDVRCSQALRLPAHVCERSTQSRFYRRRAADGSWGRPPASNRPSRALPGGTAGYASADQQTKQAWFRAQSRPQPRAPCRHRPPKAGHRAGVHSAHAVHGRNHKRSADRFLKATAPHRRTHPEELCHVGRRSRCIHCDLGRGAGHNARSEHTNPSQSIQTCTSSYTDRALWRSQSTNSARASWRSRPTTTTNARCTFGALRPEPHPSGRRPPSEKTKNAQVRRAPPTSWGAPPTSWGAPPTRWPTSWAAPSTPPLAGSAEPPGSSTGPLGSSADPLEPATSPAGVRARCADVRQTVSLEHRLLDALRRNSATLPSIEFCAIDHPRSSREIAPFGETLYERTHHYRNSN